MNSQQPSAVAFLSVGSNIDPMRHIPLALNLLQEKVKVLASSTFYQTAPLNRPEQPHFLNGVWQIETIYTPRELKFDILRSIENHLGRSRTEDKEAPRTIDLDILLFADWVIQENDLTIPDPDLYQRDFLAIPLSELAADWVVPDSGRTAAEIANEFKSDKMLQHKELTRLLWERIAG